MIKDIISIRQNLENNKAYSDFIYNKLKSLEVDTLTNKEIEEYYKLLVLINNPKSITIHSLISSFPNYLQNQMDNFYHLLLENEYENSTILIDHFPNLIFNSFGLSREYEDVIIKCLHKISVYNLAINVVIS